MDYREYKAAFDDHNFVMHYGVKGMKWDMKKRKHDDSWYEERQREQQQQAEKIKYEVRNIQEINDWKQARQKERSEQRSKAAQKKFDEEMKKFDEKKKKLEENRDRTVAFKRQLESKIMRNAAKTYIAASNSFSSKAKRSFSVLKDTIKSASFDDYKNFFKKKKK